jgi:hypothetical protein
VGGPGRLGVCADFGYLQSTALNSHLPLLTLPGCEVELARAPVAVAIATDGAAAQFRHPRRRSEQMQAKRMRRMRSVLNEAFINWVRGLKARSDDLIVSVAIEAVAGSVAA